ncbi:hypothetical protein NLI96_g6774 [Meripilus lineatus]|uniref:Urea transporter n=1 Tax=Meripilus lineatus TaxID=2056292 RepID=A0AAD5V555_9APHY|nr:hypothetical protein NLI96_g6774 [Physisporinus lineatus]
MFAIAYRVRVLGVGFFFAGLMLVLTRLQAKFSNFPPSKPEEFTAASRSVKPGLVCCGIVSAGTWSATLLQSSTAAYTFGVSGPWWYGVGGTIQMAFFAMVAAKVKMNANGAHTFLEIVKIRFGTGAHLLFTFYAFLCILVTCGSLLLGGAATVTALTGMNTIAACFLLPIGIAVYVVFGGLRATFICDWAHTIILFIIIYLFAGRTYGTSPEIGGIRGMYDLLKQAAIDTPVQGNEGGSYLTMRSNQGITFGAAIMISGYWQRMFGGISWFAIPWAFASCLGLAARALINNPKFPTYPYPLSASQTSAGLAAPAAATVVMGKGGAVAILLAVLKTYQIAEFIPRGVITVANLAEPYSAVCSGLTALLFSGVITILVSLWNPANYDFEGTRAIIVYDKSDGVAGVLPTSYDPEEKGSNAEQGKGEGKDAKGDGIVLLQDTGEQEKRDPPDSATTPVDIESLQRVFVKASWYSIFLACCVAIFVPLPMFFSRYVFSEGFYTFWVACSIIWVALSGIFCIILPLWESRKEITVIARGVVGMMPRKAAP